MSLNALRKGVSVNVGGTKFLIVQRLSEDRWQLQNTVTGEWCTFREDDLLDRFTCKELSFESVAEHPHASFADRAAAQLARHLSNYGPELVARAQNRVQYLKEIDRRQPIAITAKTLVPLILKSGVLEVIELRSKADLIRVF